MRVGVIGIGKFGSYHILKFHANPKVSLVLSCDPNVNLSNSNICRDYSSLVGKVDAVSIAVPTSLHYEVAKFFLENGVHCFVEKPITDDLENAIELVEIAEKNKLVLQVGHIERFNSEFKRNKEKIKDPLFIDASRLCGYNGRCLDVDVVLDLMIHDIDILLNTVKSPVSKVVSNGASFVANKTDVVCASVWFEEGVYASLTAHRASAFNLRKTVFYQGNTYVEIDYSHNKVDSLQEEMDSFVDCCLYGARPEVTGADGTAALKLALQILEVVSK